MNSPKRIPAAIALGFIVCLMILYADLPFHQWCYQPEDLRSFLLASAKGKLWVLLVCVQTTTWFVALLELGWPSELGTTWRERFSILSSHGWVVPIILLTILGSPAYQLLIRPDLETGLAHANHHRKIMALALIATLAILLVATEMFRINRDLVLLGSETKCKPSDLTRFVMLREQMDRLLLLMGAMLSALAVGTGAFRNSWNAIPETAWANFAGVVRPGTKIEIEDVLAYCALYSLPIFLIYVPAYGAFVRTGRHLVELCDSTGKPAPAEPNSNDAIAAAWVKTTGERTALEKALRLDASMTDQLKNAVIIISPVLTGAVSLLLPTK